MNRRIEGEEQMEIESREIVRMEQPIELNPKTVIYYSEHYKRLEGCQEGQAICIKARKFIENDCIAYDPEGEKYDPYDFWQPEKHEFICRPIPGYNKTTYRLKWNNLIKEFECSCQFFQTKMIKKEDPYCSHNLALWLFIKMLNWNRR